MADKETTFGTIFVNRYLGSATLYPQSRHTMQNHKPNGRHENKLDEILRSTRGVRGTPSKAINMTTEKGFLCHYWHIQVLELIQPDS